MNRLICLATQNRRMGRSTHGRPIKQVVREFKSPRISLLPGVSVDDVIGVMAQLDSIQRANFEYFLEEVLVSGLTTPTLSEPH